MRVYEKWLAHRMLVLEEGRQSTLQQIRRVFQKDVIPALRRMTIHEITQHHLLEVIGRIEARGSLSVAEKMRTWLRQLFEYAVVVVPDMENNSARDLHVVAVPLPPVRLLTGVRTGELRLATPDQFDLARGLWIIPAASLKQRNMLTRRRRVRVGDIPPYIVPLSLQAQQVVREVLDAFKPAQEYVFAGVARLTDRMSENTVNFALKRMGYDGRLTGHGLRATLSTALNEIGYPRVWVDAQLSHADPNRIRAVYNHAQYVEQRRVMMQDWANRLDLLEQGEVEAASRYLIVHLQGVAEMAWRGDKTPQRSKVYAPYPMEACGQQTM